MNFDPPPLTCKVCGVAYYRKQQWIHDKCLVATSGSHTKDVVATKVATNPLQKVIETMDHAPIPEPKKDLEGSRHGKYADPEKRKAEKREAMRKKRAALKVA